MTARQHVGVRIAGGKSSAPMPGARPVGRNKLAQFRHRGSAFAVGLPELRKLVPAYGPLDLRGSCRSNQLTSGHNGDRLGYFSNIWLSKM